MTRFFSMNTISKKLLMILMGVSFASIITVTFVFSAYELTTAKREQVDGLQTIAKMLSPNITAAVLFDDQDAIQELIEPILLRGDIVSVTITDNQGKVLAFVSKTPREPDNILNPPINVTQINNPLTLDEQEYGQIHILADESYITTRVKFYGQFIIILLIFALGISFSLSLILRRRFLSPILHLATIAERVSDSNDYSLRAKELSHDEVGKLSAHFNDMLETIEQRDKRLESQVKSRTEELESANEKLHQFAYQDGLTDLPNRRYFYEKLQSLIDTEGMIFALIFIDLDGFKEINDTLGHDYGDLLLQQVAKRLKNCVRGHDTVARLGGDEFTLIVEGINDQRRASEIAEVIKSSLVQPITIKNEQVYITSSIGLTFFPSEGKTIEDVVKHADQAMYLSKSKGRNRYEFFSFSMEEQALGKRRLTEELRQAIKSEQFQLFYQPIVNIDGNQLKKVEALIRWNHPKWGLIEPNDFIPVAEESGLIVEIGNWVRQQVIADAIEFYQLQGTVIQISVNTSPTEIDRSGKWIDQWILDCNKSKLPHGAFLIEVTENTLMTPDSSIKQQLKLLNNNGIKVAIDDFGVGYSSLAYLQELDIDIIKIDRSFITNITTNESSVALVKAIITMAHNIGVQVVAEGIESHAQQLLLKQLSCDYLQGFMFSTPLTKADFCRQYLQSNIEPKQSKGH
ncbi:EAL domain-containing protein [Shewanella sp. 10N.7]|uniref:bifunctional diguanylate cyclase/phosphodiesterase n=1 Tax=Shewanella sp. 10N.7 TaxID=2885093 RepID=UPI001E52855E|nr:EAL domain-containing protein [Shewanella sp. 10N.7]MCC4833718.1 EAL domain-containing protein [Shewanella sp. 10N.7]